MYTTPFATAGDDSPISAVLISPADRTRSEDRARPAHRPPIRRRPCRRRWQRTTRWPRRRRTSTSLSAKARSVDPSNAGQLRVARETAATMCPSARCGDSRIAAPRRDTEHATSASIRRIRTRICKPPGRPPHRRARVELAGPLLRRLAASVGRSSLRRARRPAASRQTARRGQSRGARESVSRDRRAVRRDSHTHSSSAYMRSGDAGVPADDVRQQNGDGVAVRGAIARGQRVRARMRRAEHRLLDRRARVETRRAASPRARRDRRATSARARNWPSSSRHASSDNSCDRAIALRADEALDGVRDRIVPGGGRHRSRLRQREPRIENHRAKCGLRIAARHFLVGAADRK